MKTAARGVTAPILGAFLLTFAAGFTVSSHAAEPERLVGTVRDTVGNLLTGVEVLFVRLPAEKFVPAAVAHSDRAGRFEVAGLLPGRYRIAALKGGYRTHVGEIDTFARNTVDLVLRPTLGLGETRLPDDASWALRVPRRGMLHETGAGSEPPGEEAPPSTEAGLAAALRMELDQLFSFSADVTRSHPDDTDIRPSETRMRLSSAIGQRGRFLVEGRRERLSATSPDGPAPAMATRSGEAISLDLAYDTSLDAQLAVSAFFNRTDYGVSIAEPSAPAALEQQRQTWGYDASWSMRLDATQHFAVALKAQGTSFTSPLRGPLLPEPAFPEGLDAALSNRAVGAHGSYETVAADGHEVQVALQTQRRSWPEAGLATLPLRGGAPGRPFWTVQADAQDTWSVATPFSLVYGLGYRQALWTDAATLVVPRVGGDVRVGDWSLRALVSYHEVTGPGGTAAAAPFRPADPLGYEAELEMPLARGVRLRGGVTYAPFQLDSFGYVHGDGDLYEHPLYLTDGNSTVREHRLALSEERGPSRTYVELCDGRADGMVAPLLPFEGLLPVRSGRHLRYWNGRFGVVYPSMGTDVRVEYRRIETESEPPTGDGAESIQETVEMRVKQDVSGTPLPGDWRLLLAVRLGTVRSGSVEAWSTPEGAESVDALHQRISAGVSVVF